MPLRTFAQRPRHRLGALWIGAVVASFALAALGARPAAADGERELRRSAIVKAVEKSRAAIVYIRTNEIVTRTWYDIWDRPLRSEPYEKDGALGSGAIFHPDGYVITNAHVISRASKIFVGMATYDEYGRKAETVERHAIPLAIDIANDLAILRLLPDPGTAPQRYPFLSLGRSNDLMVGEGVIAMGHPFRLGLTVTQGIIGGLDRRLDLRGQTFSDFMQVDAAINPGNSGGPLFDITGRWIGVNTAIYNRAVGAEGIGFAIPADRVRSLIGTAFKRRVVADDWLGVEFKEHDDGSAIVQRIYPKGPAQGSGLHVDDLVVAVNGKPTPTLYDLRMALVSAGPGTAVELSVERGEVRVVDRKFRREQALVSVQLAPVPTDDLSNKHLGFAAEDTGEFAGVVVTEVRPRGPAEKMTLRSRDIIYGLGHWEIRNREDLLMFLQFVSPGDLVDVKIRRPAGRGEVSLKGVLRAE
jgi:serine protease Do